MAASGKTGDPRIAKRLREAREMAGYESAREAADDFDLEYSGYNHHENGWRSISLENAVRYCEMYEVNLVWLATGYGPIKASEGQITQLPPAPDILAGLSGKARKQVLGLVSLLKGEAAE
jgi:hypothetical protein